MDVTNGNAVQPYVSPEAKLSQHSPTADDEHDNWSGEGSSGDEANRSQSGASKRKRPLSVSCEICKQRKVPKALRLPSRDTAADA